MKLTELKNVLSQHSQLNIGFRMPDERLLPAHAHVTEVARIDKRFVDCGGTFRIEYELGVITHSPVVSATISADAILLNLEERRTACLAPEKCLPPAEFRKFKPIA